MTLWHSVVPQYAHTGSHLAGRRDNVRYLGMLDKDDFSPAILLNSVTFDGQVYPGSVSITYAIGHSTSTQTCWNAPVISAR